MLDYIVLPSKNIDLSYSDPGGNFFGQVNYARVRKSPDGPFLYNPENDTIFIYENDKSLTPIIHKKPLLSDLNPIITMDICMDAGRFQFTFIICNKSMFLSFKNVSMWRFFLSARISSIAISIPVSSTSPNSLFMAVPNVRILGDRLI